MTRFSHLLFFSFLGLFLPQLGAGEVIVEYDFESGLQGWSNPDGSYGWRRDSGGTPSTSTGPSVDASGSSSGYYVYLETSSGSGPYSSTDNDSYFVSPSLVWEDSELEFAYHMYGSSMGSLHVDVTTNAGGSWTTVWTVSGQQHTSSSQAYTTTSIDLTGYSGQTLQIRFRGESTITGYQGDMAIDAVKIIQSGPPELAISADSEFLEGSSGIPAMVSVDEPPSSDLTVSLSGDSYLSLPATVTIPVGQSSVDFTFSILDDTEIQGDRAAGIDATATDYLSAAHNMTVYDDESPFTVTFDLDGKASRTGGGVLVQSLVWGEFPVLPEILDGPGWLFTGWDPVDPAGTPVSADRTFTGQFVSAHTVTFDLGVHGTLVSGSLQQIVADQAPVAIPDFSITENWEFSRWDDTFFNPQRVIRDHSVVAQYVPSPLIAHSQVGAIEGAYRDSLGTSVDIDGGTAVVAAPNADSNLGAIYVYQSGETGWQLEATLTAPTRSTSDYFGGSVKIDGDIILVGASYDDSIINDAGCAYIYTRSAGLWSGGEKITASDAEESDYFGRNVAVDAGRLIISATGNDDVGSSSGSVYIFENDGSGWTETLKLLPSDLASGDLFGSAVAIDGDRILVGASGDDDQGYGSGSAYIFSYDGSNLTETAKLTASDGAVLQYLGYSVSLEGDTAVVGTHTAETNTGAVYVYQLEAAVWTETKLTATDRLPQDYFGYSLSISGDTLLVGARSTREGGHAYVYLNLGGQWIQAAKIVPESVRSFGTSVALDAGSAIIGAPNPNGDGEAFFYDLSLTSPTVIFDLGANGTRDGGGALTQILDLGQSASEPIVAAATGWTFTGWDTSFDNVYYDRIVTAQYTVQTYDVSFDLDAKGERIGGGELSQSITAGSSAVAPDIEALPGWSFTGWDVDFSEVQSDLTVVAQYLPVHTVTFELGGSGTHDGGGNLMQSVVDGESAIEPSILADAGWSFTGWDVDFSEVTGDLTVTALYTEIMFQVTFSLDGKATRTGGGSLVQTVSYGAAAIAPVFDVDPAWNFDSWDTAFDSVTSDLTVTGQFSPVLYVVTFDLGAYGTRSGGGELSQSIQHGTAAVAPTFDVTAGWRFTGWDTDFSSVTGNLTVTAQYVRIFTVTFELDGKASRTGEGELVQVVDEGASALAPNLSVDPAWTFDSWDTDYDSVVSDLTVTAQYSPTHYNVTFELGAYGSRTGGGELSQSVQHGTAGIAPTFDVTPGWYFDGWDSDFSSVTSDLTVTAQYLPVYSVTFDLGDYGALINGDLTQSILSGGAVVAPVLRSTSPLRGFIGWDGDLNNITGDTVFTAQYDYKRESARLEPINIQPLAAGNRFGASVDIDGSLAIAGAFGKPGGGSVSIFSFEPGGWNSPAGWNFVQELNNPSGIDGEAFGWDVAISDGTVVVGAPFAERLVHTSSRRSGYVYVFNGMNGNWSEIGAFRSSYSLDEYFGYSVAIDGEMFVAGAPDIGVFGQGPSAASAFKWTGEEWEYADYFSSNTYGNAALRVGNNVAISNDHVFIDGYIYGNRSLFVHDREKVIVGDDEKTSIPLLAGDGYFDTTSTVAAFGPHAAVSTSRYEEVSIFFRGGGKFEKTAVLENHESEEDVRYGRSIALGENILAVGIPDSDVSGIEAGSVFLYRYIDSTWVWWEEIQCPDPQQGAWFGADVGISGNRLVVGAPGYNAEAGSVFVYDLSAPLNVVTFDLDGKGWRSGGGQLTQLVAPNIPADAPIVGAFSGWLFDAWDTDFSAVTEDTNVSALYLADTIDSDADGLFDFWERLHFPSLEAVEGTTDSDGDGADNRAESIAGTDPNDRSSLFGMTDLEDTPAEMSVTWPSVADRAYEVFWSTDLVNWTSHSTHSGTGGEMTVAIDRAAIDAADGISGNLQGLFVRVGVSRP